MEPETQLLAFFLEHWVLCVVCGQAVAIWRLCLSRSYAREGWRRERERSSQRQIDALNERLKWQSETLKAQLDVFFSDPARTLQSLVDDTETDFNLKR